VQARALVIATPPHVLQFGILGPLAVLEGERPIRIADGKLRALLAALLLHAREVRSVDELIDDLWADKAPATARSSLHNLVSILRRTLGGVLETGSGGYTLAVDDDQIDARRFEQLIAASREQAPIDKVWMLEQALTLWRGSPLVDVRYESFAQTEIRRLEELHLVALESSFGAKIDLGLSDLVVPELLSLVDRFPFRERLRMHLMVALHRCGRSVEALATYAAWHSVLNDSWGIDPGVEIEQLRSAIRTRGAATTRSHVRELVVT
jgi:DNA-binding SARP family transcriptional activator